MRTERTTDHWNNLFIQRIRLFYQSLSLLLWGKKDRDANSKGTMLLLRVQLIEYHDKYMRLGDIPSYAYENFMEMYDAYHALGGNGMITKMMHEIEELHLKKKEV